MKSQKSMYPAVLKLCAAAVIGLGASVVHAGTPVGVANASAAQGAGISDQTDRLIVKYKDEAAPDAKSTARGLTRAAASSPMAASRKATVDQVGRKLGLTMKELHTIGTGARVLQLNRKVSVADAAKVAADLMASDATVEYAEPDRIMKPMFTPNDPYFSQQWDYTDVTGGMRLPAAWDKATGTGIRVAVIDTGYRPHVDLQGQILAGYDFIADTTISNDGNGRDSDASDPGDWTAAGQCGTGSAASNSSWHGTHVAGTIAALTNNGIGVAGVAYNAKVVPVRVLGQCGGYTSDIADGIVWASGGTVSGVTNIAARAQVINMSLGGGGACDTTTQTAINGARSRGTVVVVAAGNESQNVSNSSPANCSGVIAVAATNKSGGRASYSNYGTLVDVAAPGGDSGAAIMSTLNAGTKGPGADSYAGYMGTSMATPHVAGVVALMLSKNPNLTPDQVEAALKSSARAFPASCSGCGAGIVDASAAIDAAAGGGTSTGPTISETESNNTISTANAVSTTGTTVNGTMSSSTDTDYFVVQVPAGKTLSATMTPNSSSDYDLYIYNSAGTQLAKSENGAGSADTASSANTGSSTAARYVRVVYYSGGTGSTSGKYTLKLSW
ncbi:S8 family peptidase [Massilia norwichensis]|uniref:S8 family serine peptidase n=1 Tax=Massilia norwichensis TaxID=1442366 RepID=A0ABT2ABF2_9BURK|nr:S8 family peptidase [Massilia norwichensis]MCS0591514.1 S8 family serine peptidase [Massilia norwichensis]